MFLLLKEMTGPKGKVDSDKQNSTEKKSLFGIRESAGFFFVICDTVPVLLAYTDQRISSKENLILFQYSM